MWRLRRPGTRGGTDPKQNHLFVEINDPGMGAAASGSAFRGSSTVNILGVTTAFLRSTRCAMPGCGKERHDPIHAVADE
jgi:hypothetical protein